jgi:hypothetical protein
MVTVVSSIKNGIGAEEEVKRKDGISGDYTRDKRFLTACFFLHKAVGNRLSHT